MPDQRLASLMTDESHREAEHQDHHRKRTNYERKYDDSGGIESHNAPDNRWARHELKLVKQASVTTPNEAEDEGELAAGREHVVLSAPVWDDAQQQGEARDADKQPRDQPEKCLLGGEKKYPPNQHSAAEKFDELPPEVFGVEVTSKEGGCVGERCLDVCANAAAARQ